MALLVHWVAMKLSLTAASTLAMAPGAEAPPPAIEASAPVAPAPAPPVAGASALQASPPATVGAGAVAPPVASDPAEVGSADAVDPQTLEAESASVELRPPPTVAAIEALAPPAPPHRTLTVVEYRPPPSPPEPARRDDEFFIGGYGGFDLRASTVSKKVGTFVGARGGVLLGRRLSIGGAIYKLAKRYGPPIRDSRGQPLNIKMAYGGATLGLTLVRGEWIDLTAQMLIGAGVGCISDDYQYKRDDYRCRESVRVVVAEPGAVMFINLSDWFRIGVDLGYRAVARERWSPGNDFRLSGGYAGLNLQFGWFDRPD